VQRTSNTKERLKATSLDLFSYCWYETVSVAEICRDAEVSNGIFYHYYQNKEEIFREILDEYLAMLREHLEAVGGTGVEGRLESFLTAVAASIREDWKHVSVFREGQYRFPEYERHLREIYMEAASRVYDRDINEAEYIYVAGGIRFATIRSLHSDMTLDLSVVKDAVYNGIFTKPLQQPDKLFPTEIQDLDPDEESSRNRLIDSGIELFGRRGYYNVNVYEVARNAGFSVGTFYLYFKTKEEFLAEIVALIGRRTRHFITINLDPALNRLETELRGLFLFLKHFSGHPEYYSIVREAEFVVSKEVDEYYNGFERGYLRDLSQTRQESLTGKRIIANALLGVSHYTGIEVLYSGNITDYYQVILQLGRYLHEGIRA
jgi:AcrR family transcriptional regulator